jgi:DNA-binding CsgD family transcriptional regulator
MGAAAIADTPLGCPLSGRELLTLTEMAGGLSQKAIATSRHAGESTIRSQVMSAHRKLHTANGAEAIVVCIVHGWIVPATGAHPELELLLVVNDTLTMLYDRLVSGQDFRVTPAQHDYLEAFERMLRTHHDGHGDAELVAARLAMGAKLDVVLAEARVDPGQLYHHPDAL